MSKRTNPRKSLADFFSVKRKIVNEPDNTSDKDENNKNIPSCSSSNSQPSKHNHKVLFDFELEQVNCENEIDWTGSFDFVFHFLGTSSGHFNVEVERGECELASTLTSKLKVRIEGSATHDNRIVADFHVRIDENGET